MFPESYLSCLNASVCAKSLVRLLVMLWTASQSPLSMGFSRQEYWSGLPFPPAGDLSHPGIKPPSPVSSAWQVDCFTAEPRGKPGNTLLLIKPFGKKSAVSFQLVSVIQENIYTSKT